jgi:diguanylate cyclase (GGDEF)-like protein/PAS domain S-box-containing protein
VRSRLTPEKYQTFFEASPDAGYLLDKEGHIVDCNKSSTKLSGYSRNELLGRSLTELFTEASKEIFKRKFAMLKKRNFSHVEVEVVHKGGLIIEAWCSGAALHDSDHNFAGAVTYIQNIMDRLKMKQQAILDPLTGVFNRHYFNEAISKEVKRARRYKHPLSLLMVDVDRLKNINDKFGHLVGDKVLRGIARILRQQVRDSDMVVRYGGDEFLIVMPESAWEGALRLSERLKEKVKAWGKKLFPRGAEIGISIGVCTWLPGDEMTVESLLREADEHMYLNKRLEAL